MVYVLDMAEIPTFQEKPRIDPNPDAYADQRAEELRQNLHLELNGQPAQLRLEQRSLSFPEGAGGLPTMRLEAVYSAPLQADASSSVALAFRDDNDPTRIGWREIIARPGRGHGDSEQQRAGRRRHQRTASVSRRTCSIARSTCARRTSASCQAPLPQRRG